MVRQDPMNTASLAILLLFFALAALASDKVSVTLDIYSARINPLWHIEGDDRLQLLNLVRELYKNNNHCGVIANKLGYRGFKIVDSSNAQCIRVINSKEAEEYLLQSYIKFKANEGSALNDYGLNSVIQHVTSTIQSGITTIQESAQPLPRLSNIYVSGPDNVTEYNPDKWNNWEYQDWNNCYNYATDVLTNTFAQPGRGSGNESTAFTCESAWKASKRDGLLVYSETTGPAFNKTPALGHYVSLVIWPDVDFHWYRKDYSGYYSHKPGSGFVTNFDSSEQKIDSPSTADISPYTQNCGYMIAIPSRLKIN
ncbi:insoluble matrix shell protein [Acrasis kona]|uniref:Insoluble matrix shell protein n=1 Tax=Acrasis kona TaxID=1008807 RepID=A0AAW2YU97_9EUKA